ncbi:MAG: Uma2 family endonuclease [Gemmatimonadaceae bacterium]|nr:Uma2 family endonuclease [Gemmatimonadaceae bacterium]
MPSRTPRTPRRISEIMATHRLMTAEGLLARSAPHARAELVGGRLIARELAGYEHGYVASRVLVAIATFVQRQQLGHVLAAETGFTLFRAPDTVRAPDVAYVSAARVPTAAMRHGFPELAPDLAVEILSPDDRAGEVRRRVRDWIAAGTRLVWIIDPIRRAAHVHRADGSAARRTVDDLLSGDDVLPGFSVTMRDLLG